SEMALARTENRCLYFLSATRTCLHGLTKLRRWSAEQSGSHMTDQDLWFEPTIELPAIELFLALRRGKIQALGKLLPDGAEIIDFVEQDNSYGRSDFDHLVDSAIPHDFWTNSGIDWLSNAVTAHGNCYCDVSMSVEVLMSLFPGERTPVDGAQFVGDCLFVKE